VTIKERARDRWPLSMQQGIAVFQAMERVGLDPSHLFKKVGLDWSPEAALGQYGEPSREIVMLVRQAVHHLESAAAELSGGRAPHPFQYDIMWFAAAGCSTLANAIGLIETYAELLEGRMCGIASVVRDDGAMMVFQRTAGAQRSPVTFLAELLRLVMFDRMLSWLAGEKLSTVEYVLDYPPSYAKYVPPGLVARPVRWAREDFGLLLSSQVRDLRNCRTPAELGPLFPLSPLLFSDKPDHSYAWRVGRHFDAAIADATHLPALPDLARLECCSVATLRRRLEAEGTTALQIKNERRLAWALLLIQLKGASLESVAERLGFADETAFRRAFKQWTGSTPGAFRTKPE